jgi:Tol biopolymer transport system component
MRHLMRAVSLLIKAAAPAILLFGQAKPDATLVISGENTASHVSRDGKYLAFTNWINGELYIRELATGTDRQMTHKAATDSGQSPGGAFVSADSRLVAYEWNTPTGTEIRVMPVGGGEPRRVQTTGARMLLQGWHPNGRELLVVSAGGLEVAGDLGFVTVETGAFRRIAAIQGAAHARLSPDALRIVFSALSTEDPTQSDIGLIDCATGRMRLLLSGPSDDYSPDWTSDSNSIVFISDRGGRPQLWTLRLAAGDARPEAVADVVDGDLSIAGVTREGAVVVEAYDIGGTDSYSATVDWTTGRLGRVELLPNPFTRDRAGLSPLLTGAV